MVPSGPAGALFVAGRAATHTSAVYGNGWNTQYPFVFDSPLAWTMLAVRGSSRLISRRLLAPQRQPRHLAAPRLSGVTCAVTSSHLVSQAPSSHRTSAVQTHKTWAFIERIAPSPFSRRMAPHRRLVVGAAIAAATGLPALLATTAWAAAASAVLPAAAVVAASLLAASAGALLYAWLDAWRKVGNVVGHVEGSL